MKRILFVVGGLSIGGVETYIVRLAAELVSKGFQVDVILLSDKFDQKLFSELDKHADIYIHESFPFIATSSWINAFLTYKVPEHVYDIVHVVDLLTLSFVYFHRTALRFTSLSIGIYHSMEICWWSDKNCYFRNKMLELYNDNIEATLFPSESVVELASRTRNLNKQSLAIVPLGINCSSPSSVRCSHTSKKIVSIGRLVDFKVYNSHLISQLSEIRKFGDFEYYIYGDGPERDKLLKLAQEQGVDRYVHFMGEIDYNNLLSALEGAFCFVGSGTVIIEASAAGIPSIVGIESIEQPLTCGFFSDVPGYSYNEEFASTNRISFVSAVKNIASLNAVEYETLSKAHILKAESFDIKKTSALFLSKSDREPVFKVRFNRLFGICSFILSIVRFGPRALKRRFISI